MNREKEIGQGSVKNKGFWAVLKESIAKSNDGCGPGCGCHAASDKKAEGGKVVGDAKKI